jgi:hypothetical protein
MYLLGSIAEGVEPVAEKASIQSRFDGLALDGLDESAHKGR